MVESPGSAAVVGGKVDEVLIGLIERAQLGVKTFGLKIDPEVCVPKLFGAQIGVTDFKAACADVGSKGKALLKLGAAGTSRNPRLKA